MTGWDTSLSLVLDPDLCQFDGDIHPGPDGFLSSLFQQSWSVRYQNMSETKRLKYPKESLVASSW